MTVAAAGPYAWDPHLLTWAVLVVAAGSAVLGHRHLERSTPHPVPWTRRQRVAFGGGWLVAAAAVTWPLGPLAAHWSLTALVAQRVLLVLAAAPLLLTGMPDDLIRWLTRPRWVDGLLLRVHRPPVAIAVVTVLVVGSMAPALVRAQADAWWARGLLDVAVLVAGFVLWLPVIGRIPGIPRLRPVVRFGYLVAQAVVPAFLSFIYIFSTRPLYAQFARSHAAIGLRPINDQQIAGFVAKLSMLTVLLVVGGVILSRAPTSDDELDRAEPLVWADVERQFERADRRRARSGSGGTSAAAGEGGAPADDPRPHQDGPAGGGGASGGAPPPGRDRSDPLPHGTEPPEREGPEPP